jgi:hypothetical protein
MPFNTDSGLTGVALFLSLSIGAIAAPPPSNPALHPCGDAWYLPSQYTCYDGDLLCPILDGNATLRCGPACYYPSMYGCSNRELIQLTKFSAISSASASATPSTTSSTSSAAACTETPVTLQLSDPPYENYFLSDCHSSSQVVVTSPISGSNLTIIGPRLLVAWPAGNSGVVAFFAPENGINGTLGISLLNGTQDKSLSPVFMPPGNASSTGNDRVGISALMNFNSSAIMNVAILGSIRTIRDFTEGPSLLHPKMQDAVVFSNGSDGGATLTRQWLDNVTTTEVTFVPHGNSTDAITINNQTLTLPAGTYNFTAVFDYPQLTQLNSSSVLDPESQGLKIKRLLYLSCLTRKSF